MHFSIDGTVHTTAFDKPVVDHWLERKIAQTAAGSTINKLIAKWSSQTFYSWLYDVGHIVNDHSDSKNGKPLLPLLELLFLISSKGSVILTEQ